MSNSNEDREPRGLQQQPQRHVDRQQQQGTDTPNPQASGSGGQMGDNNGFPVGEGSYEGTEKYNERTRQYLNKGQVEKDAAAARPKSAKEAEDLQAAEKEGLSHSKAPGK